MSSVPVDREKFGRSILAVMNEINGQLQRPRPEDRILKACRGLSMIDRREAREWWNVGVHEEERRQMATKSGEQPRDVSLFLTRGESLLLCFALGMCCGEHAEREPAAKKRATKRRAKPGKKKARRLKATKGGG